MSEVRIRKAEGDDLPRLQDIARRTIDQSYRSFLGNEGVDWFIDSGESDREIREHIGDCDVLLKGEDIVAFAVYFEDLIHLMMVDVPFHRTGIGSRLLAHCENQLLGRGNTTIRLETFEGNHQAINFYLKNGWSVTRKQENKEHGFVRVLFEKST